MTRRLSIIVLLLLATLPLASAPLKDSKGKDFWIAFMPNAHSFSVGTLIVFVTAEQPTTGTITYVNRRGQTINVPFSIATANAEYRLSIAYQDLELDGYDYNLRRQNDEETAVRYSMHVVSNEEVTVYAEAREQTSTDAWLVYPTDVLGTDHIVLCYSSDGEYGRLRGGGFGITRDYPSQFCVIATQNNTRVTITNSAGRSPTGTWKEKTITLQAGQVYLVQAEIRQGILNDDLTGSRVSATKPVAVIAGVVRTELPRLDENNASRDCLIEQMPPTSTWGLNSIIIPPKPANDQQLMGPTDGPRYRIIAAENNTSITINATQRLTLSSGQYYEGILSDPKVVEADKPILVASYLRTSQRAGAANGDPSMFLNPPTEQFLNTYTVINIEPDDRSPYYTQHLITLIVRTADTNAVRIDGIQPASTFVPVAGTSYSYTHVSVQRGPHTLTCPTGFGVYIYGYGVAESYGYIGGMAFERLRIPRVQLVVHDTTAAPGDSAAIVVTYQGVSDSASFFALGIHTMKGELAWNATQFIPLPVEGRHTRSDTLLLPIDVNFDTLKIGDTLYRLPGRIVLGNTSMDSVYLRSTSWYDAAGDSMDIVTDVDNGAITLSKICRDTAARLFDPDVAMQSMMIDVVDVTGRAFTTFSVEPPAASRDVAVLLRQHGVPAGLWFAIERRTTSHVVHRIALQE
ncbi:MAG: IgGFc-binding protein [Bacteroidetes bacterium]|nr:IgGFc-binding protein [Bacteroidota bacterium]